VDGVTVDRVYVALLMVVEYAVADEGARTHDVPVGRDIALLRVHDEACCFGGGGRVRNERAYLAEVDRDDALDDVLDGFQPIRIAISYSIR
jgi:hypothetical protein